MITPDKVISYINTNVIIPNIATIGITDSTELSNDSSSKELQPPYAGTYEDFSDDVVNFDGKGSPNLLPTDIIILVSSAEHQTATLAMNEAYTIAGKILSLVPGFYTIDNELVNLRAKSNPIEILVKSAAQSVLKINLKYFIDMKNA